MKQYLELLKHILDNGISKDDRTGTGTTSSFGYQMRFNLADGFPLVTTKKIFTKAIIHELLWFLKGDTNIQYLCKNGIRIWNEWAFQPYLIKNNLNGKFPMHSEEWQNEMKKFVERIIEDDAFAKEYGDLGPVYGKQWTAWGAPDGSTINQIEVAEKTIRDNPDSRRIIVSGWNVGDIYELLKGQFTAPPPCHTIFQFYVVDNKLSCQLYQRSADVFLGVPFNIASYALLTMMLAHVTGRELGEFIHTFGDVHIYNNHIDQVNEQLSRETRALPSIHILNKRTSIFDFEFDDFKIEGYNPHPSIKAPIAI